jgi:predicted RNase H-like nuclease (RuvC/YqgF family)
MAPAITDEELHDEAVVHALTGTRQLRKDLAETKHNFERVTAEYAAFKQDATEELRVQKHEYESKLVQLRAKIEAVDSQLKEAGRKLEHFERLSFELGTKCDDIEKFYLHELRNIRDAANHVMLSLISNINNVTVGLNDAAKHSGDGLVKQVENSANNMGTFIDDLRAKRDAGEYRQRPNPMQDSPAPLTQDAEESLAKLVQQIKAKPYTEKEEPEASGS